MEEEESRLKRIYRLLRLIYKKLNQDKHRNDVFSNFPSQKIRQRVNPVLKHDFRYSEVNSKPEQIPKQRYESYVRETWKEPVSPKQEKLTYDFELRDMVQKMDKKLTDYLEKLDKEKFEEVLEELSKIDPSEFEAKAEDSEESESLEVKEGVEGDETLGVEANEASAEVNVDEKVVENEVVESGGDFCKEDLDVGVEEVELVDAEAVPEQNPEEAAQDSEAKEPETA